MAQELRGQAEGRATIFEVAEQAGVSITTVSHVFSGKRRVNPATRRRVHEAAARLAYQPRLTARALATGRTMTLALQLPTTLGEIALNPFFSELLPAMSAAAIERGYSFVFVPGQEALPGTAELLLGQPRVDAAVLVDPEEGDPFVERLRASALPFVTLGRLLDPPNEHWVDNDHADMCRRLLDHLDEAGYTRPAFLSLPQARMSLLVDYLTAFGELRPEAPVYAAAEFSEHAGCEAATEFLDAPDRPDAVITTHHRLAMGVVRAARDLGIAIPAELGVATVGGNAVVAHARPPLTSINLFPASAGERVIEVVDALLSGRPADGPVLVPAELAPRESTRRRG
jgi:DNA-binding LacI/PurR family transcriptional regulator